MKSSDERALQALLIALAQSDRLLPEPLQQQLHDLGEAIERGNIDALAQISELAASDSYLQECYQQARDKLHNQDSPKHRQKSGAAALFAPILNRRGDRQPALTLQEIAPQLLKTSTPKAIAQTLARPLKRRPLSDNVEFIADNLQQAASEFSPEAIRVLQLLDRRVHDIDSIAFLLDMPLETADAIAHLFWQLGYIEPMAGEKSQSWLSLSPPPPGKRRKLSQDEFLAITFQGTDALERHRDRSATTATKAAKIK